MKSNPRRTATTSRKALSLASRMRPAALLAASLVVSADPAPAAEIADGPLRARLQLPDPDKGFYRGTRFDWSGMVGSLEYAGHEFYPQWFQRVAPDVHDFVYDGPDIVASPCTAATGPAEEFVTDGKALGFEQAKPGGTFIKIGVGVLRRPDERAYDPYRLYAIQDGGRWSVTRKPKATEFRQELSDAQTGYGYDYRKTVALNGAKSQMVLHHVLRNTGKQAIRTSVYNHNFLYLDRQAPGPDFTLTLPFALRISPPAANDLAVVRGKEITFARELKDKESVYLSIQGFGESAADHDIRIENRRLGAGLRITGDRPISRLALWAIRAPLSIEPFIDMAIPPGAEFNWETKYEYYTLPKAVK